MTWIRLPSFLVTLATMGLILAGLNASKQMIVRGIIILIALSLTLRSKKSN
ncbi:MAG: hypothetical protein QM607_10075 [Microbacterium sp.]